MPFEIWVPSPPSSLVKIILTRCSKSGDIASWQDGSSQLLKGGAPLLKYSLGWRRYLLAWKNELSGIDGEELRENVSTAAVIMPFTGTVTKRDHSFGAHPSEHFFFSFVPSVTADQLQAGVKELSEWIRGIARPQKVYGWTTDAAYLISQTEGMSDLYHQAKEELKTMESQIVPRM
jgi:hypothetical protein